MPTLVSGSGLRALFFEDFSHILKIIVRSCFGRGVR